MLSNLNLDQASIQSRGELSRKEVDPRASIRSAGLRRRWVGSIQCHEAFKSGANVLV
jgi:hypothetical protein